MVSSPIQVNRNKHEIILFAPDLNTWIKVLDLPTYFQVKSWISYSKFIAPLRSTNNEDPYIFRGQSKYDWELSSTLGREVQKKLITTEKEALDLENRYIDEYKKTKIYQETQLKYVDVKSKFDKRIDILQDMQDAGVYPTRLLDLSFNPDKSLYFSCKENFDDDGGFYIMNAFLLSWSRYIVAHRSKNSTSTTKGDFQAIVKKFNSEFRNPSLNNAFNGSSFKNYIFNSGNIVTNIRMNRQEGEFLVSPSLINENYFKTIEDEIMENIGIKINFFHKIRIKNTAKQQILEKLSMFGINESSLHPELGPYQRYKIK